MRASGLRPDCLMFLTKSRTLCREARSTGMMVYESSGMPAFWAARAAFE